MRTYFWISLFISYRIEANQLIKSNVILVANKGFIKKKLQTLLTDSQQYYSASLRCYATVGKHVAHLPLTCDGAGEMRP
jgi:hypothetical protein